MKKIAILKGTSNHDVLRIFADQLADGFRAIGREVEVFDLNIGEVLSDIFIHLRSGRFSAAISFNGLLGDLVDDQQRSLLNKLDIPFVSWLVDHPAYHFPRMQPSYAHRWTVCAHPDHQAFLDAAQIGGQKLLALSAASGQSVASMPFEDRPYSVLFAGSWMGHPEPFWENIGDQFTRDIVSKTIERLESDPSAAVYKAISDSIQAKGITFNTDYNIAKVLFNTLTYIRRLDRIRLFEALAGSDLPVTVVGDGWESLGKHRAGLKYLPARGMNSLVDLYAQTRFVVSINAGNGASERSFNAAAYGACVISDTNPLLAKAFEGDQEIAFFNRCDPETAVTAVQSLHETGKAALMAKEAMKKVQQSQTWAHRATELLSYVEGNSPQNNVQKEMAA
jgi:hypothetical protein